MEAKKTRAQLRLERLHAKQIEIKEEARQTAALRRAELRKFNKADATRIGTLLQQFGFGGIATGEIEIWLKQAISVTSLPWEVALETVSTEAMANPPETDLNEADDRN
jgi:hypothetical protein